MTFSYFKDKHKAMDELNRLILALKAIRTVPQFLFKDGVYPTTTIKVKTEVLSFKRANPGIEEIDFIVHSAGGLADDAYRIIRTLRKNFTTVNVIVPFWAKSAATLLSIGGSKIVMDEFGEFGPLDAQIGKEREDSPEFDHESALNDEHSLKRIESRFKEMYESMYIRIFQHDEINMPKSEVSRQLLQNLSVFYKPLLKQINPYKLGEKRRILEITEKYATRILVQFGGMDLHKVRSFADFIVNDCPDHGYVIDYDMIRVFLDNVVTSKEFAGPAYQEALSQLALHLLQESPAMAMENLFIGFISDPTPVATAAPAPAVMDPALAPIDIPLPSTTTTSTEKNGKSKEATV